MTDASQVLALSDKEGHMSAEAQIFLVGLVAIVMLLVL